VINDATDIGADEFDAFAGVTFAGAKPHLHKRWARVKIGCPSFAASPCTGTVTLSYAQGKKRLTAGSAAFLIGGGTTEPIKVKISKRAFNRLHQRGKLSMAATAAATDAAAISATTSGKVKLKG
jgi:hypothetical protein